MRRVIASVVCLIVLISASGCIMNSERRQFNNQLEYVEKLGKLRDKGFITDEEFDFKKREILKLDL